MALRFVLLLCSLTALVPLRAVAERRRPPVDAGEVGSDASVDREAWRLHEQAMRLWSEQQPGAWLVFMAIPTETAAGREARQQLARANEHYQNGLDLWQQGQDTEGRAEIDRGRSIGPIDPHLYLDVGDIMRSRGRRGQAIRYYTQYLLFMNQAGEAVDPETLRDIYDYLEMEASGGQPRTPVDIPDPEEPEEPTQWPAWIAVTAIVGLALFLGVVAYVRRGWTLQDLVDESPDLHPRIAYAVGCLRHELLKHRLGALGEAVIVLRTRKGLSDEQRDYLREKLYGGESLSRLWLIYLETFDRLGGRKLNLQGRDRAFRRAGQAVQALEGLQGRFNELDAGLADRLDALRSEIARFDRHLKSISDQLCQSKVDGQLLREAVFSVQSEPRAAEVGLDEIRFAEPPPDVHVEVFRTDLLLVLRNLVRNAILALSRQEQGPRALGLEVELRTEPTGDESVLIKVLDTSHERVTTDDIYGRRLDHGLGLVAAAVSRYDGSITVESVPVEDDEAQKWQKAVVVRFFRALGENS